MKPVMFHPPLPVSIVMFIAEGPEVRQQLVSTIALTPPSIAKAEVEGTAAPTSRVAVRATSSIAPDDMKGQLQLTVMYRASCSCLDVTDVEAEGRLLMSRSTLTILLLTSAAERGMVQTPKLTWASLTGRPPSPSTMSL